MSMNRDNFRSNQPPSKVLHVRNLPNDATEDEVTQFCQPFGRVVRVKMSGKERTQAFVEFENMNQAMQMVAFFVGNSNPPKIRNKSVYMQFSTRSEIGGGGGGGGGGGVYGGGSGGGGGEGGCVVLIIMDDIDIPRGPTLDTLHTLFSTFGSVAKIQMFEKQANSLQALVQMTDAAAAKDAKQQLDGRSMPAYLVPNYTAGEIRMKVSHSQHADINVRYQSERSRDFTNPHMPWAGSSLPSAASMPGVPGADLPTTSVILIQIDNVAYPITVDALHTICVTYGYIHKMTVFEKGGNWQALVQYGSRESAAAAKQCLEGHSMYEGGYNKLKCQFSMHADLAVRVNDDRNRDFSTLTPGAAVPGAGGQQAGAGGGGSGADGAAAAAGPGAEGAAGPAAGPAASPAAVVQSGKAAAVEAAASIAGRPAQHSRGIEWEAAHEDAAKQAVASMNMPLGGAGGFSSRGPHMGMRPGGAWGMPGPGMMGAYGGGPPRAPYGMPPPGTYGGYGAGY